MEQYCEEEGISPKAGLELNLILEELVTNIISYAYGDDRGKEHIITVNFKRKGDYLEVEVVDDGAAFDPLGVPPPDQHKDIDRLEPGGLGIHLVRNLTDEVAYHRENGYNIFTFKKSITA